METKEQLIVLLEVCRQDLKITKNREKLERLSKESVDAKEAADKLAVSIQDLEQKKSDALKKRRALDEKLQAEKANLRKWEARAEKIKGEREYTALMSEIGAQKRIISGIEAEMAEVSEMLKTADGTMNNLTGAHQEKLAKGNSAYEAVKELLSEEENNLSSNESVRAHLLEKFPKVLRARYDRIYDNRAAQGIALVRTGICQACMRMIPRELFIRVCKGEVIEQCPSCQRILVADLAPDQE